MYHALCACSERMCCITQALCCSKRTSFTMRSPRFVKAPGRPEWGALERLVVLLAPSFRASRGASMRLQPSTRCLHTVPGQEYHVFVVA